MTRPLQPGDAVEVLKHWAFATDPSWISGYVYVRAEEPSGCIIVRHVGGHLDGCESRWAANLVRAK